MTILSHTFFPPLFRFPPVSLADGLDQTAFVVEIDDEADEDVMAVLLEPAPPPGLVFCTTGKVPGVSGRSLTNLQTITLLQVRGAAVEITRKMGNGRGEEDLGCHRLKKCGVVVRVEWLVGGQTAPCGGGVSWLFYFRHVTPSVPPNPNPNTPVPC